MHPSALRLACKKKHEGTAKAHHLPALLMAIGAALLQFILRALIQSPERGQKSELVFVLLC